MEEPARFRLVSPVFVVGFGLGTFVGVALALIAFAVTGDSTNVESPNFVVVPPSPEATQTSVPVPTASSLPQTTVAQNVRLGPGEGFAIIGILSRGDAVEIVGRDESTQWVAVRFPPGSTGLGWLPVSVLEGVSGLGSFAVILPTPLARLLSTPSPNPRVSGGNGSGGEGPIDPAVTPTPSGPPDLAVTSAIVLDDGRIRITIENLGPGNLSGFSIPVLVAGLGGRTETWRSSIDGLAVGGTLVFETETFLITADETTVFVAIDPGFSIDDADRSNNSWEFSLSIPVQPTPTPTPRPSFPSPS